MAGKLNEIAIMRVIRERDEARGQAEGLRNCAAASLCRRPGLVGKADWKAELSSKIAREDLEYIANMKFPWEE